MIFPSALTRSRLARLAITCLVASSLGLAALTDSARAVGTVLLSETFVDLGNPWDNNLWNVDGDITSDPNYPEGTPAAHMVPDSLTASTGRLQLTDVYTNNERGYALYNSAQPTSGGLDIYFNASLKGDGVNAPADGLVFFLKDGADTSTGASSLGLAGGALGYSAGQGMLYGTPVYFDGLSNGLLGIGFDAYGNYYQYPFVGLGCTSSEDQSVIGVNDDPSNSAYQSKFKLVVRGSMGTSRRDGYCRIATTNDSTVAINGTPRNVGVPLDSYPSVNLFTETGTSVRIVIDPQDLSYGSQFGTGYIYLAPVGTTDWTSVPELTKFELPEKLSTVDTFKFGFVAGTGTNTITTQVWSTRINSIRPIPRATWQSPPTFTGAVSQSLNFSTASFLSGELNPTTFSISAGGTGLPAGITLGSDGILSGNTTATGTFTFNVHAATAGGSALDPLVDQTFTLEISGCPNSLVTISGGDQLICFSDSTSTHNWTVPDGVTVIRYLIVAGGGGGGGDAAGGGAGGESLQDSLTVSPADVLNIKVGAGGLGGNVNGGNGEATYISVGATNISVQGGAGGHSCLYNVGLGYCTDGAGGIAGASGGSGGRGAYTTADHLNATNGEDGTVRDLPSISIRYGAGGGGGDGGNCLGSKTGGATGGGNGFKCAGAVAPTNGADILGAGGGGGGNVGGNGGGGSVYLRFTPPVSHSVTYRATSHGSISGIAIQSIFHGFNSQLVSAVPDSGYHFLQWSDSSTSQSRSDRITQDETFTAYFEANQVTQNNSAPPATPSLSVPEILWNSSDIQIGDNLSEIKLNASSPISGVFTYKATPKGDDKVEIVLFFTPEDLSKYSIVSITKTVKYRKVSPSPTPSPTEASSQNEPKNILKSYKVNDLIKLGTVYFKTNTYYLSKDSRVVLNKISQITRKSGYKSLVIQGNTDIQKGVDNNWLSKVRAEAVSQELSLSLVNTTLIREWFAGSRPAVIGFNKEAFSANRRVDIYAKVFKETSQISETNQSEVVSKLRSRIGEVTFNRNEYGLDGGDMKLLKGAIVQIQKLGCTTVFIKSSIDKTFASNNSWLAEARSRSIRKFLIGYLPNLGVQIESEFLSSTRKSLIDCK